MPTDTPKGPAGPYSIGSDLWPGLSKLIEECGEVVQVAGKILGSGGQVDHWDGSDLGVRLIEELGDLKAAIDFVAAHSAAVPRSKVDERRDDKFALFQRWHGEQLR